jgi:hypothetical protein
MMRGSPGGCTNDGGLLGPGRSSHCHNSHCHNSHCHNSRCHNSHCHNSRCHNSHCRNSHCRNSHCHNSRCNNSHCRNSHCICISYASLPHVACSVGLLHAHLKLEMTATGAQATQGQQATPATSRYPIPIHVGAHATSGTIHTGTEGGRWLSGAEPGGSPGSRARLHIPTTPRSTGAWRGQSQLPAHEVRLL